MPEIMTAEQAAAFLKINKHKLYQLKAARKVPFHQVEENGKLFFLSDELLEWVRNDGKISKTEDEEK